MNCFNNNHGTWRTCTSQTCKKTSNTTEYNQQTISSIPEVKNKQEESIKLSTMQESVQKISADDTTKTQVNTKVPHNK